MCWKQKRHWLVDYLCCRIWISVSAAPLEGSNFPWQYQPRTWNTHTNTHTHNHFTPKQWPKQHPRIRGLENGCLDNKTNWWCVRCVTRSLLEIEVDGQCSLFYRNRSQPQGRGGSGKYTNASGALPRSPSVRFPLESAYGEKEKERQREKKRMKERSSSISSSLPGVKGREPSSANAAGSGEGGLPFFWLKHTPEERIAWTFVTLCLLLGTRYSTRAPNHSPSCCSSSLHLPHRKGAESRQPSAIAPVDSSGSSVNAHCEICSVCAFRWTNERKIHGCE